MRAQNLIDLVGHANVPLADFGYCKLRGFLLAVGRLNTHSNYETRSHLLTAGDAILTDVLHS